MHGTLLCYAYVQYNPVGESELEACGQTPINLCPPICTLLSDPKESEDLDPFNFEQ